MRRIAFAFGVALCTLARGAGAQTVPSPYRFIESGQNLGPFASWIATDRGKVGLGPKSGLGVGLQYAFRLNDPMALSALIAYFPTERDLLDTVTVNDTLRMRTEGRTDLDLVLVAGRLQFTLTGARTWHGLAPYVYVGAGLVVEASGEALQPTLAPNSRFDFGTSFLGQIGAGIAIFFSDAWSVRLAGHDDFWQIESPPALLNPALDPIPQESEWTNNLELSVGVTRHF